MNKLQKLNLQVSFLRNKIEKIYVLALSLEFSKARSEIIKLSVGARKQIDSLNKKIEAFNQTVTIDDMLSELEFLKMIKILLISLSFIGAYFASTRNYKKMHLFYLLA